MIKYFTNKSITVFVLVVIMAALFRLPGVVWAYEPGAIRSGVLQVFFHWVQPFRWLSALLALSLTLWQGFTLNTLAQRSGMLPSSSGYLLPLIYACLASFYPANLYLSNLVMANSLFVLGLGLLASQSQSNRHSRQLFYVSLLFGMASLIVPETYWMLVYLLTAVMVFKTIQFNDVLAICFGMAMPFFFVFSSNELFASPGSTWKASSIFQLQTADFRSIHWAGVDVVPLLLVCMLGIVGWTRAPFSYYKNNTETRRSLLMVSLFTVFALILLVMRWESLPQFYLILLLPLALFLTPLLLSIKRAWLGSALMLSTWLLQQVSLHHRHWELLESLWSWVMPF